MSKVKKPDAFIAPSLADPEKNGCFAMFVAGWTAAEIEEKTGIRADKIRQWSCRESWPVQKRAIEEAHSEKHPATSQPLIKAVQHSRKGELKKTFIEKSGEIAVADVEHWHTMAPQERLVVATDMAALNKMHRDNLGFNEEEQGQERGHISLSFLMSAGEPGMVKLLEPEKVKQIEPAPPSTDPSDY